MGHGERFPPPKLNAGCGLRKETIPGRRRNGQVAAGSGHCALRRRDPNLIFGMNRHPVSRAFARSGVSSFCRELLRNARSAHSFIDALATAEVHRVIATRPGPEAADREARLQR